MSDRLNVRRAWGTRLAGLLSMVVCLGAVIVSVVQERRQVEPGGVAEAEVTLKLAASEISVPTGDPLNEAVAEVRAPLVSYLVRELITERLGTTQLSADLEIDGPRDELTQRGLRAADTSRVPAAIKAGLEGKARWAKEARARARLQDAANLPATRPAAAGINSPVTTASANPAAIESQKRVSKVVASGDSPDDRIDPNAGRRSPILVEAHPRMPSLKPRLKSATSVHASGTIGDGAAARDQEYSNATTAHATSTTLDSRMRPAVALAPIPFASNVGIPDETHVTNGSAGPPQGHDRLGMDEAAARLADGLRAMREEALSQREERVFMVDVEDRVISAASTAASVRLDPAFNIRLHTAKSELAGKSRGGIRFYADGSSTGGRIELELLGEHTAINVQWSTGAVTVERWGRKGFGRALDPKSPTSGHSGRLYTSSNLVNFGAD